MGDQYQIQIHRLIQAAMNAVVYSQYHPVESVHKQHDDKFKIPVGQREEMHGATVREVSDQQSDVCFFYNILPLWVPADSSQLSVPYTTTLPTQGCG